MTVIKNKYKASNKRQAESWLENSSQQRQVPVSSEENGVHAPAGNEDKFLESGV